MPESQHASSDRIEGLAHELRRLKRLVGGLQEELKTGLSGLFSERTSLRKRTEYLDEVANDATSQQAKLEDRVAALEERTAALESRREISTKSFESLSARLTELGVEVAAAPPSAKMQHALEKMDYVAATSEVLTKRVDELESCLGRCRSDLEASLDRCHVDLSSQVERSRSELESRVERNRSDLAATVEECRSNLESVMDMNCQQGQEAQQSIHALRATIDKSYQQSAECRQDVEALKSALCSTTQMSQPMPMQAVPSHHTVYRQGGPPFPQQSSQADLQQGCRSVIQHHRPAPGFQQRIQQPSCPPGQRGCVQGAMPEGGEDPRLWSESQLGLWLVGRGLPISVARAFEAHLVNGMVAVDLNEDDLASMSITDQFYQRRVLKELRTLLSGGPAVDAKAPSFGPDMLHQSVAPAVYEPQGVAGAPMAAVAAPRPPAMRPQAAPARPQSVPPRPQSAQGRPMPYCSAAVAGRRNQPPAAVAPAPASAAAYRGGWM